MSAGRLPEGSRFPWKGPFSLAALGAATLYVELDVPDRAGKFLLQAKAQPNGNAAATLSRRKVTVEAK